MGFYFFYFDDENKAYECNSVKSYLNCLEELQKNFCYDKSFIKNNNKYLSIDLQLYKNALSENNYYKSNEKVDVKYFYRGHFSINYKLLPSVFRDHHYARENFYYHQIKVECPSYFIGKKKLDQLVTMQHYDCPTRLLDITSNPLVALYFACKNFACSNCTKENNGVVYVFVSDSKGILYSDSDKALMLSSLAKFSLEQKKQIYEECMKNLMPYKEIKHPSISNIMKKFQHEVRTENPSFKLELNPLDLLSCFFVQPEKSNQRILKQDGAFIISGLSSNTEDSEHKLESMVYKKIIIKDKDKILEELDKLGINESTLFPEIDKVANYLKNKSIS